MVVLGRRATRERGGGDAPSRHGVSVGVEAARAPAQQQPERERHDHHADRQLGAPAARGRAGRRRRARSAARTRTAWSRGPGPMPRPSAPARRAPRSSSEAISVETAVRWSGSVAWRSPRSTRDGAHHQRSASVAERGDLLVEPEHQPAPPRRRRRRPGRRRCRRRWAAAARARAPAGRRRSSAAAVRSSSSRFWNTPPESTTVPSPRAAAPPRTRSRRRRGHGVVEARRDDRGTARRRAPGRRRTARTVARASSTSAVADRQRVAAASPASPRPQRLELDRRLALVVDLRRAARRARRRRRTAGPTLVVSGEATPGAASPATAAPARRVDARRERRGTAGSARRAPRPATRRPSATARGSPRSPPGMPHRPQVPGALEARQVADQQLAAPDRAVGAVAGAVVDRPDRRAGLAVLGQAGREVGVMVLHPDELDARRARARTWSTGTRGAGRGRPPRARPRTGARSARCPRVKERSVSQFVRSPMWWPTQARRPLARQKVFFSSAPQASSGRGALDAAASSARGHVAARAAQQQRRRRADVDRASDRVVGAHVDRAVVDQEEVGDRRQPLAARRRRS